jgi:RNA recognition motif-containing protein
MADTTSAASTRRDEDDSNRKEASDKPLSNSVASTPKDDDDSNLKEASDKPLSNSKNTNPTITDTVFIGNLPRQYATEAVVEKLLQPHGRVQRVSVQQRTTGKNTSCFAFGQFANTASAAAAMAALHGRKLGGRPLVVRPAHENSGKLSAAAALGGGAVQPAASGSSSQQRRKLESRIQAIRRKLDEKQQEEGCSKP